MHWTTLIGAALAIAPAAKASRPPCYSGIYPHLAVFNTSGECGIGAVVPWAGKLWFLTYPPHMPNGSDDKLYELAPDLSVRVRPESVGCTDANRMIHPESGQLNIGHYFIDRDGRVRAIPPAVMPGRLTATARHLTDPANKLYLGTMEEGLYEVDVHTLAVKQLYRDRNLAGAPAVPILPGAHGKGMYSGQGRLFYSNNGEAANAEDPAAMRAPAGCLGAWDGNAWTVLERKQFTEITGPGGIEGAPTSEAPIWALGWDRRSIILKLLDHGLWQTFRLPKADHTYDAAHGWYTEWPRIRAIGSSRMLMTMHGTFWDFPNTFSAGHTAGIRPLSTYLKMVTDFCEWNGRIVCACDDASTMDNPLLGQSQSNLWFLNASELTRFGAPSGNGGPWVDDEVHAGAPSEPYLFAGYERRMAHIAHRSPHAVRYTFEVDRSGDGRWTPVRSTTIGPMGYGNVVFPPSLRGEWMRVRTDQDASGVTVWFTYSSTRRSETDTPYRGLASLVDGQAYSAGPIRPRGEGLGTLQFAASTVTRDGVVREGGYYEIGADMKLRAVSNSSAKRWMADHAAVRGSDFAVDRASAIYQPAGGGRYRLPLGPTGQNEAGPAGWPRGLREVVTERSLLNCCGTIYEVPRPSAGGAARMRPICTHNRRISDFCSWRGMLVMSGVSAATVNDTHCVRSEDGRVVLWFGTVDDLWGLGKPRGHGGPWLETRVSAGQPSDPYLMSGYDRKSFELRHDAATPVGFRVEVDITSNGAWQPYTACTVPRGKTVRYSFPTGFSAYWVRLITDAPCRATALFTYD